MAEDKNEICNAALIKIGAELITDIDTETEKRAVLCKQLYDKRRKKLLRSYLWNFAEKRSGELALLGASPEFEFDNAFALPNDNLRVLNIEDDEFRITRWRESQGRILINRDSVKVKYIFDQIDTTKFDALFDDLLALDIAIELAYPLVQDKKLKKSLQDDWKIESRDAKSIDAQTGHPGDQGANEWLNSRRSGHRINSGPI